MALSVALLEKIKNAKTTSGGNNIFDGQYVFEVHRLLLDGKFKGTMFIAELGVLESEAVLPDVKPNMPGTTCSVAVNLDTNVSAPGNMKAVVLALLNKVEAELSGDAFLKEVERLTGPDQPARGMLIADETYRKTIQSGPNAGKPFTGHRWVHVDQTPAEVAERRKMIDAGTSMPKVEAPAAAPAVAK